MDRKATECPYCGALYEELASAPARYSGASDAADRADRSERAFIVESYLRERNATFTPGCVSFGLMFVPAVVMLVVAWKGLGWGWLGVTGATVGILLVSWFIWAFIETHRDKVRFKESVRAEVITFMRENDISFAELMLAARRCMGETDSLRQCLEDRKVFGRDVLETG